MRYLLISFFVLICFSCSSYPKKKGFEATEKASVVNPYFSNPSKDYVYKASINVSDKKFGGIFIVKKLEKNYHRIVFTTEMGNKIFDFSFLKNDFKVNHILKDLNKKILINILKNDFRVLITEKPFVESTFIKNNGFVYKTHIATKKHYHYVSKEKLQKVTRVRSGKENVEFLFYEINDNIAEQIQILHKNFTLEINLKVL